MTAVEVLSNRSTYDSSSSDSQCPFEDSLNIVMPQYKELCLEVTTDTAYQDTLAAFALSKAVDRRMQMYFPKLDGSLAESPLTRVLNDAAPGKKIVLMWSALGDIPATGPVQMNHFVPLVRCTPTAAVDVYVSDDGEEQQAGNDGISEPPPDEKSPQQTPNAGT